MTTKYLTLKEVSKWLRVSTYTLRRWIKSGKLKAVKVGKRGDWRVEVEEINKILK